MRSAWNIVLGGIALMASAAPAPADILIGSAAPITGKMAWLGEQHQRAVEMAVSQINAAGGLLGETVDLGKLTE